MTEHNWNLEQNFKNKRKRVYIVYLSSIPAILTVKNPNHEAVVFSQKLDI
jgi:hypothetical protein